MIRVVVCDGARVPRAVLGKDPSPLQLSSMSAGVPNIRIPSLAAKLHGAVPNEAVDLLRIAAFVYWADQMITRPVDTDVSGEDWKRTIEMLVPVLEPDLWQRDDVAQALGSVLNYGTDHEWLFHFEPAAFEPGPRFLLEADADQVGDADSVLLFSGGADSLCAAALEGSIGRRPLLVSHSSNSRSKGQQKLLAEALGRGRPGWCFPHRPIEIHKRGIAEKERTQRSRGFLFSAIGAAIGAGFKIDDIVLADNGFVSVGLPLNGQTVGAKMSRTTHPRFQYLFNKLCALVLPGKKVRNPLLFKTRAEALEILQDQGLQHLLASTTSCAASSRLPGERRHCGSCSQCVDRRIGVTATGLERFDALYRADPFLDELTGDALLLAESYVRLMRKVEKLEPEEMLVEYPELADCAFNDVDGEPEGVERIMLMLRRQAETAHAAWAKVAASASSSFVRGDVPATSMVALSTARRVPRKRPGWQPRQTPLFELSEFEEKQFQELRFGSRVPIVLTGERLRRASNVVRVGGEHLQIRDADFILLLRLVVGLCESTDGYCVKGGGRRPGGLADEPGIVPGGIDQAIERLRTSLSHGLGGADPRQLVEVSAGRVRLSTHRKFIEVQREQLQRHPSDLVIELLGRIPPLGSLREPAPATAPRE